MATAILIPLSRRYTALVSPEDYDRVSQFKWSVSFKKGNRYAVRSAKPRYLHHFITDCPKGEWYDHKDGNGLNCTRGNLRRCTKSENARNKKKSSASSNPYKGIDRRDDKWRAYIYDGKRRVRLGTFPTPEAAALAYDAKARELHGEFARLNFPERAAW